MKKKCQVIMLPSENKSEIIGNRQFAVTAQTGELKLRKDCSDAWINSFWKNKWINYNLYILSNEDLKKGDWCFHKASKSIVQYPDCGYPKDHVLKVIATTDKLITKSTPVRSADDFDLSIYYNNEYVPNINPKFIEKFVDEYNEDTIIIEVNVEYENAEDETYGEIKGHFPKIDKNNFITITKIKESWTREEVIEFTDRLRIFLNEDNHSVFEVNQWIEENL